MIEEANEVGKGEDIVGEMALAGGPDDEKGKGVDDDEHDESFVRRQARRDPDVLRDCEELRCENATGEDGEGGGEEAGERYPGDFIVTRKRGFDADLDREAAVVIQEQ